MGGRLDGKVAVITGGASGIGRATVELFEAEGAKVVLADIQADRGEAIAQGSPDIRFVRTDVTREDDIKAMIDVAVEEFGRLDILFNNAGTAEPDAEMEYIRADAFDRVMSLHVRAALLGIKHAIPVMRKQGGGAIVSTSSVAGIGTNYGPVNYSIAKAAIIHLTKLAAVRLASDRIRVNCVNPGMITTAVFGRAMGLTQDEAEEKYETLRQLAPFAQPLPVGGEGRDIAEAVLYLASDAARFVTGQALVVDGGLTAGQVPDPEGGNQKILAEMFGVDFEALKDKARGRTV
ncbi:SDR family oxidoreductase [Marinicauda algicola]|nr:SDR family oxidoreductase [Marinicauda algicola]